MRWNRLNLALTLLLVAITGAAFRQVAHFEWVGYDDALYVTQNPNVRDGLTGSNVAAAWTLQRASNWHPLTMLSHALDCELYGLWAGGHHLTNLLLHLMNVVLLFVALESLVVTGARTSVTPANEPGPNLADESHLPWKAAFVAAMFGVHPLHVESVAWIAERKDVLSAWFFFVALIAYARYVRQPSARRMSVVALAMTGGLLAKPMLVTLPCVLLLLDYWPLRRFGAASAASCRGFFGCVREKLPLFALSLAASVATYLVQSRTGAVRDLASIPLVDRIANAVVAYATYLRQAIWPVNLTCYYPHPGAGLLARADYWPKLLVAGAVLIGLTWFAILFRRRCPAVLVGWLWFLGTLVPVIGLVQVGRQAMADRYTYLPLVGLFLAVAWGIPELLSRVPARRVMLAASAVAAVIVGTLLAARQAATWRDGTSLWTHNLAVVPDNLLAHCGLAQRYAERKQVIPAEEHCRAALQIAPDDQYAMLCLAGVLLQTERNDEALALYTRIVGTEQRLHQVWASRAEVYRRLGQSDAALDDLRRAVALEPREAAHHRTIAEVCAESGRFEEAVAEYRVALFLDPTHRATRIALGDLYHEMGDLPAAIEAYSAALALEPKDPVLRRRLDEWVAADQNGAGSASP